MSSKRSSIFGVGINDASYNTSIVKTKFIDGKRVTLSRWECPIYSMWRNMLARCYCAKYQAKNKNYIGVTVCSKWFVFSAFREWVATQNFSDMHLDKDLLSGVIYSPETCLFLPPKINYFIRDSRKPEGLNGACFDKSRGKWITACALADGGIKRIGRFNTELEAHQAWKAEKLNQVKILAATVDDQRIAEALVRRYS